MAIIDLFIKPEKKQEKEVKPPTSTNEIPVVNSPMPMEVQTLDKETEAKIWNMIINKNLPGPDYLEFKNIIAGLADVIPEETKQMQGAFNVLKKSYPSFTKDIIVSSIDTYIGIVNEEKDKGMQQCAEQKKAKIGSKEEEVRNMEASLNEINFQIEELQKKQQKIIADISKINSEISAATEELNIQEKAFLDSIKAVIDKLNSDKQKVINSI